MAGMAGVCTVGVKGVTWDRDTRGWPRVQWSSIQKEIVSHPSTLGVAPETKHLGATEEVCTLHGDLVGDFKLGIGR